jgi:hypothetical protein
VVCISEGNKELETNLYLTISKILYLPFALLLLFLYPLARGIFLLGFTPLFILPEACSPIPKFPPLLALATLFSALFYALDIISIPDKRARKYIASILSITALILLFLSTFLEPCLLISLLLALATLFSALFYALDMISMSDGKKYIASILSITALVPPILSFILPPLCGIYPCMPIFPVGFFSLTSRPYIALALFSLYMSSSFFAMRFFLAEERGLALVVGAALISLIMWFLFFSNLFSLLFLGIIPCSAVVYAPLCKMRKPMSTIKRILIFCQLFLFAFVFFALPRLR